jgi:anthranilate phosphoribosyltransferase
MQTFLESMSLGGELSADSAATLMELMLSPQADPELVGAVLVALQSRAPTATVLTGFAKYLMSRSIRVKLSESCQGAIDVCGTGGDGHSTFNISTAVAFVVASTGLACAKHGNRAVSSKCGSFDVLEALGVGFANTAIEAERCLAKHKLTFMYAPSFHPSFGVLSPIRKSLGIRTILNAMGPLLNPARVSGQLIGVYSSDLLKPMAEALSSLGVKRAMVVCGDDGADEISLCSGTKVAEVDGSVVTISKITPEDAGLERCEAGALAGGDARYNADVISSIFTGKLGAPRDIVLLNAAASLMIGGRANNLRQGVAMAAEAIDSGKTRFLLRQMQQEHTVSSR